MSCQKHKFFIIELKNFRLYVRIFSGIEFRAFKTAKNFNLCYNENKGGDSRKNFYCQPINPNILQ